LGKREGKVERGEGEGVEVGEEEGGSKGVRGWICCTKLRGVEAPGW